MTETDEVYTLSTIDVIQKATDHILGEDMPDVVRRDVLFEHFVHWYSHCQECKIRHSNCDDYLPVDEDEKLLQSRFQCHGWGHRDADIMILGIGPGAEEDEEGIPFMGDAGKVLRRTLELAPGVKMNPEHTYMTNSIICRPCEISEYGNMRNRDPIDKELNNCNNRLLIEIALVKPKVIVCMGAIPYQHITGLKRIKVGAYLDKVATVKYTDWKGEECETKLIIAYHPSYVHRKIGTNGEDAAKRAFATSLRIAVKLAKEANEQVCTPT